ncbi:hypothetical protein ILYODFUR_029922 [Ilyodon furcidens]|uniref:Uncharacterized protein n=1 Tax=Ilyodon furcidens TaxID=33524 RepID=A0ABV0TF65_9TELE
MFISMHSIGRTSFCMNYCINVAWHGGDQPAALLGCNGSPGCFDTSRPSALLGLMPLIFLLTTHRIPLGFRSGQFAGQSNNTMVTELAFDTFGSVGRKMKSISPLSFSTEGSSRYSNTSENTAKQHQQMTWHPKSSPTGNVTLNFK